MKSVSSDSTPPRAWPIARGGTPRWPSPPARSPSPAPIAAKRQKSRFTGFDLHFAKRQLTGQANARFAKSPAKCRDLPCPLPHQRLLVDRPLRRHHEICLANFRFQVGRLGEHLEAGLNRRPGKRHQPKTQPSRRPGAGRHREITAKRLGGDLGQAAEAGVRLGEILRAHTLLRPINPRGPIDTEQGF